MKLKPLQYQRFIRCGVTASAVALFGSVSYAVFVPDEQPIASLGALTFNTYDLTGGTSVAYRGDYIRSTWDGDLVAYSVDPSGGTSLMWRAKDKVPVHGVRKIGTSDGAAGMPFRLTSFGATQKAWLSTDPIVNYLRGDTSQELTSTNPSGTLRQRYSKLGAVIHSRPYYHKQGNDTRVYVGGNDGMLHAFNAATGEEVFAYVPFMLFDKLKDLSVPTAATFKYYVDGQIAIKDIAKSGGGTTTMLVSGLGGGAKGLFALDVSNTAPSETDFASMFKWEITGASTGYGGMGNVYAAPQIVKLQSGTIAALVPNGPNSSTGVASLFVINIDTGAKLAEITAGIAGGNGLGGIGAVDIDNNGTVDTVYAGDQKGTMWKFDFSGSSLPATATALFTPAAGTERPITAAPSLIRHTMGGVMVNFGTGQVYDSNDLASVATEYIYGIWDSSKALTRLATPTLSQVSQTVGGVTTQYRVSGTSDVNYLNGDRGWRVALTGGERLLGGDTLATSGRYVVTTYVPNPGTTQGSWVLQLNSMTGGQPSVPIFDVNGDLAITTGDNSDKVSSGGVFVPPVGKFLGVGVWSQPVVAKVGTTVDIPYFNSNLNTIYPATTTTIVTTPGSPTTDRGVSGGHFDFDIFYEVCNPLVALSTGYMKSCAKIARVNGTHVHEYDDIFDVVGVNMLAASHSVFNLSNGIPLTSTPFKIMLTNTNYSPAARIEIVTSGAGAVNIEKAVWDWPLSPEGFLAETAGGPALTFTRANLTKFIFKLPKDAFSNKEWKAGSGDVRAGLIPTQTGCMQKNTGAQGAGATGAWMNGAITFQLVKSSTPASAVEAAIPVGAGGYRLKTDTTSQAYQLTQYTSFWHHPNGFCIGDAGWTKAPPPDLVSDALPKAKAAGSSDPTGSFYVGEYGEVTGGTTGTTRTYTTYQGVEVIVTREWTPDGIRQTITTVGGSILNITLSSSGTTQAGARQVGQNPKLGRLGWRELVR